VIALFHSRHHRMTLFFIAPKLWAESYRTSKPSLSILWEIRYLSEPQERYASRAISYSKGQECVFVAEVHALIAPSFRYWKDEKQTRAAMRRHPGDEVNLWIHTGDKGIMDKDGYLKSECHGSTSNIFSTDSVRRSCWSN
jgi:hypothetical protein